MSACKMQSIGNCLRAADVITDMIEKELQWQDAHNVTRYDEISGLVCGIKELVARSMNFIDEMS